MKIAFLVLCHKNDEQINLLLSKLINNFDCDVYLHIDKKNYYLKDGIKKNKNLYVIPESESYEISWGGINMINATLQLIRTAKNSKKHYDYLFLLSGQDYLISQPSDIIKKLKNNSGYNFINVIDSESSIYNRYKKLYEIPYANWMLKNNTVCKILKRIYMILTGGFNHSFKIFKKRKPFDFELMFGSQWWCLTSECAYYMLAYCDSNPEYIEYFKKSIIPDECFFQTLFMSSPYKKKKKEQLTFVNWKSGARSPETFLIDDLDILIKKSRRYCFARKFDMDVDKNILKKLDVKFCLDNKN